MIDVERKRACARRGSAKYRAAHPEVVRAYLRAYGISNRATLRASRQAWSEAHRDSTRAYTRSYKASNLDVCRADTAKRRAAKRRAVPVWVNLEAVKAIYRQAAELTAATGIRYDVDHVIPLRGKNVCGLHVEYNLQILTHVENMRKNNKLEDK